jgi:serine phosphatase RsbU (regulator of sigma subunit)
MIRSIAYKLSTVLSLAALLPMVAAFGIATRVMHDSSREVTRDASQVARSAMRDTLDREATGLVTALVEQAKSPLVTHDFAALAELVRTMSKSSNVRAVRIIDQRGWVVADGTVSPASRRISGKPYLERQPGADAKTERLLVSRPVAISEQSLGQVVVEFSLGAEAAAERRLIATLNQSDGSARRALLISSLLAALLLGGAAVAVALGLGKRFVRPIVALRDGTRLVAAGNWNVRLDVTSEDEIGQLTGGFNSMAAELGEARVALQEQARISREMEIAERIQTSLVPRAPEHPEFEFAGRMDPADEVGGDFYDVLSAPGQGLWLTIGDVSNHGLGSGLVMLMAQSAFATAWAMGHDQSPSKAFVQVNSTLYNSIRERMGDNKYITSLVVAYRGDGRFQYAGGHLWPLVYRAATGVVDQLHVEGAWLGIVRAVPEPPELEFRMEPGDILCLYTDGVIEAMNEAGEQYDLGRLKAALGRAGAHALLDDLAEAMFQDFDRHTMARADDRTLLLVRRR